MIRIEPTTLIVSPRTKRAYAAMIIRMRRYESDLDRLGRWQLLRRYQLRRKLGVRRATILLPYPLRGWYEHARWRRIKWRHRHDPEW